MSTPEHDDPADDQQSLERLPPEVQTEGEDPAEPMVMPRPGAPSQPMEPDEGT
jgi:hypothetical protein